MKIRRCHYPLSTAHHYAILQAAPNQSPYAMIVGDTTKHHPELSEPFHAQADPTRRSILSRLAERPAPVTHDSGLRKGQC